MTPLPNMSDALSGLEDNLTYRRSVKKMTAGETVEVFRPARPFTGVVAPLPPQKLQIKPEGQRSWRWASLWTRSALGMDDLVTDAGGNQYRVMEKSPWNGGGFGEYHLAQPPTTN